MEEKDLKEQYCSNCPHSYMAFPLANQGDFETIAWHCAFDKSTSLTNKEKCDII